MADVIRKATNRFTKGLIMDFSPENTKNEVLTHALNATLLTFNGNELSLQNDMGNARVESAYLPDGYMPVGTCEYGGIIYIVSYNPLEDKSQIGCFPSPERNISSDEVSNLDVSLSNADFQETANITIINEQNGETETQTVLTGYLKSSTVKKIVYDKNLQPGDKYFIYQKCKKYTFYFFICVICFLWQRQQKVEGEFFMKVVMLGNDTKEEIEKRLQVVASAGNLSRADGTVTQVFESRNDYEANLKLARAVVGYGHKSIAEHDYLVFAIEDVSPIVEQTIIGYRLTSFTIKSRRNVDFRNVGFYVPDFHDKDGKVLKNNKTLQKQYKAYMQSLFDKYGELVDEDGNRAGGIIPPSLIEAYNEYGKPIKKHAGLGVLASFFLPGGPVLGAITGIGTGLLAKSNAFQQFIFGDDFEDKENRQHDCNLTIFIIKLFQLNRNVNRKYIHKSSLVFRYRLP